MKIVQVSLSLNIFESLAYGYQGDPAFLRPGLRVVVPVGSRLSTGWIVETQSDYKGRVKPIIAVIRDAYLPDETFLNFTQAISNTYFTSVGTLLDASLPPKQKNISSIYLNHPENAEKAVKLNKLSLKDLQGLSAKETLQGFYKGGISDPVFSPEPTTQETPPPPNRFIIDYQRTDRYREVIAQVTGEGKNVLFAVPDNLTAAFWKDTLENVDVYNSELKPKDRDALWAAYMREGKTGVIVGGQSAVLLPVPNLGAVIIDRAGSTAFRRSFYSVYNTRFLAQQRAVFGRAPIVEGFSAPAVHTFKDRSLYRIEDRRETPVPVDVQMIKQGIRGIPEELLQRLEHYAAEDKKILLVVNRKESVRFLFCGKCKKIRACPACGGFIDTAEDFSISCRRCGLEKKSHNLCTVCNEALTIIEGVSISSMKKNIKQRVPESGIMTLSSEGLKEAHMYPLMKRVEHSKLVISTPVIANPFFRRRFDAVIYFRPESYFDVDAHDAAEKIFSLAAELRELVKPGGSLDIFSTFHFHYSLKLINDEEAFFDREMKYRQWFHLPPFCNLYRIEVKEKDLRKLGKAMRKIYQKYKEPLNIRKVRLDSRKKYRGTYKGILEAHAQPEAIQSSGLLSKRNIAIDLELI